MRTLYTYYRSSAAYRVRIALNLKGLDHTLVPVHLLRGGGEQFAPDYRALNPQSRVPTLVDGERVLTQSLAIVEYLDETYPGARLMPADALGRARVRAMAQLIACDIHPLGNLAVLRYLTDIGLSEETRQAWTCHWIARGLHSLEALLVGSGASEKFCYGETPTLADCCLVPQLFNARRFGCALDEYPRLLRIEAHCQALPAFEKAAPQHQPDAEPASST